MRGAEEVVPQMRLSTVKGRRLSWGKMRYHIRGDRPLREPLKKGVLTGLFRRFTMFVGYIKQERVQSFVARVRRIVHKHLQIQELPLPWSGGQSISPREAQFLQVVGERPGSNVTALAEALGVTKSAVSQMVRRLEEKGLVSRAQAWDNGRDVLVILSPRGEEVFREHLAFHLRHLAVLGRRLDRFSEEALRTAEDILEEVERTVDERIAELFP